MLYLKKGVGTTIKIDLKDKVKGASFPTPWRLGLTNDITNNIISGVVAVDTSNSRYDTFLINGSLIAGFDDAPDGSYTFKFEGNGVTYATGKAILYDGTYTSETKFGDEVTYTEHDNTYSNTQYITI